jgi:lysophospholipase L1-like esterase
MNLLRCAGWIVLGVVIPLSISEESWAQDKKAAKRAPDPAFAPVTDNPALPRVLLLGDSISIGYTLPTREALAGKANVHRAPTNCGPTTRGITQLDRWLGDGRWDVIHFNFGLHDLKQIDGKHQVPIDQYERNLREIVARLKKTGARLIWCSTTPVPAPGTDGPPRKSDDVVAYNAAAKKVMDENGIPIDDLYAFALPQLDKIQRPNNVHFTAQGSAVLAQQVAASILKELHESR